MTRNRKHQVTEIVQTISTPELLNEVIDFELSLRFEEMVINGTMTLTEFTQLIESFSFEQMMEFCHITVEPSPMDPKEHLVR